MLVSQSFVLAHEVGLAIALAVERARELNTRAHNSEKRYDRPHGATHLYHLYTYGNGLQPGNRVLVS